MSRKKGPNSADLIPKGQKNYMTPQGAEALQAELDVITKEERPKVVEIVS